MQRVRVDPVFTNAGARGFGKIAGNRATTSFGARTRLIRIACASGAGPTVTLELKNFKHRTHRSDQ